jgi:hypothetical protein
MAICAKRLLSGKLKQSRAYCLIVKQKTNFDPPTGLIPICIALNFFVPQRRILRFMHSSYFSSKNFSTFLNKANPNPKHSLWYSSQFSCKWNAEKKSSAHQVSYENHLFTWIRRREMGFVCKHSVNDHAKAIVLIV